MTRKKRWINRYTLIKIGIIFLLLEVILRSLFGFCNAVILREDKDLEYIALPQRRYRFFNNIFYNSYSQRNREVTVADSIVILDFGDSVINGGVLTDQDSLATTLLTNYLSVTRNKPVLVTNISAGSWGPDNCFAYLKKFGNFGAKKIFLSVSSHDAYDNMTFKPIVGKAADFPDKQYTLALVELFDRYIFHRYLPVLFSEKTNDLGINKKSGDNTELNSGFNNFKAYSDSTGIPLIVYLHAEKTERERGEYNDQGKLIEKYCEDNHVPLIKELDFKIPPDGYRDNIHFSERGQYYMFNIKKNFLK
ncbi:MAG TPA: hypothetical protein VF622_06975 [Segetibacter sp.]|jgi:hypothetical protein